MKKLLLLINAVFIFNFLQAQDQAAVWTHYHVNPILVTPAVAGFNDVHQIQMNLRSAWTGFEGAPKTYNINYHGPIGKTLGVGAGLLSETIGNTTRIRFQMNYAFRYEIRDMKLAAGFSTDFHNYRIADSVLDADPDIYNPGDPLIEEAVDGRSVFDAALGFWGSYKNQTYFGLTFPNLIVAKIGDIESGDSEGSFFSFFIFNLGHKFIDEARGFTIEPSLMMRKMMDGVPFQADFNIKGGFMDEKLIAGLSYRAGAGGAVGLLLGTKVDPFRIYYGYDVGFAASQKYHSGAHEVTIMFEFGNGKKKYDRD